MSEWVSQWVSEWQGHLLSCSGQLKSNVIYVRTNFSYFMHVWYPPTCCIFLCLVTFLVGKFLVFLHINYETKSTFSLLWPWVLILGNRLSWYFSPNSYWHPRMDRRSMYPFKSSGSLSYHIVSQSCGIKVDIESNICIFNRWYIIGPQITFQNYVNRLNFPEFLRFPLRDQESERVKGSN